MEFHDESRGGGFRKVSEGRSEFQEVLGGFQGSFRVFQTGFREFRSDFKAFQAWVLRCVHGGFRDVLEEF